MFARVHRLSKWTLVVSSLLVSVPVADAQEARGTRRAAPSRWSQDARRAVTDTSDVRARLADIHAAAQKATRIEEYTDGLRDCKEIYDSRAASQEERAYLRKLSAWLYVQRGEAYGKLAVDADAKGDPQAKNYETQALKDFSASIELAPTWRAYHNRGVSYAVLEKFKEALADFNEAIEANPKQHGSSFFNRAEVLYELSTLEATDTQAAKLLTAAERDYTRAINADPTDVQALTGRAHAKFELQRPDEALRDFDLAIEIDPDNAVTHADRGDLHAALGNWKKAATDLQTAIRLDRTLGRAYQSAAWLMATCPDESIQNRDLALQAANRAIQLDGRSDYRYLDTVAAALANAGEFEKAEDWLRQAMQLSPPPQVVPELEERLATYRSGRAYRERR